jgi:hypothetical protein
VNAPQTIVTVRGLHGRYSLHAVRNGEADVYGPVVEDHDRPGRWVGDTSKVCRTRVVGVDRITCETEKLW